LRRPTEGPESIGPLLETKLYVPRLRRAQVARPRLSERLSRGVESKLTLISGPAGFGKTTVLADWLAAASADQRSVAWLSLDASDNQPAPFWTYVIAALQTVVPEVGVQALSLLESPQEPIQGVLATLLNELNAVPTGIVLVLDDYHVIDAEDIQEGMAFLLEHLPPRMHVVLATRVDPGLPLARLRGRGELVEIRAADLRFTPDEAAAYLNDAMGLDLAAPDIAALEGRTEGWIAALQLAALSMQGRDDIAGFIAGFAGDDRYIVDYLVEEVLQRQPEDVRRFLLETSILDRLSGPLCDAVTGRDGGKAVLEALDRGNLFLVPLDDRRRWYRYHHLFADVLRARLLDELPDRVPELHRRATEWYEQNGERSEAIGHSLAAKDFERAADLIELAVPAVRQARQEATMRRWLGAIPDELLALRPVLSVHYAGTLLVSGQLDGAEARLRDAERWLSPTAPGRDGPPGPPTSMVVVDKEEFRRLPASIAIYRAAQAQAIGDVAKAVDYARQVLDLVGEEDHLLRGAAAGFLGLAYWTRGDLEAAHGSWADCMASLQTAGHISDMTGCAIAMGDIRKTQGRLRDAMSTYEHVLQLTTEPGTHALRGAADMHVGMSDVLRERNDLDAARQHLQSSRELGGHLGLAQNPYRWCVAMSRIREAEGDAVAALDLLDEAERLYVSDYFPNVRPIAAQKARLWIATGRLDEALGWARECGLSAEDELSYLQEFEHVTLARLLLAQAARDRAGDSMHQATEFLERLMVAAEAGGRSGSLIEILLLLALAHQARGNLPAVRPPLEHALSLAEPEGYVRIVVGEGEPMAILLRDVATGGFAPPYVARLLRVLGEVGDRLPAANAGRIDQALIEPLSERELEVLRLLAGDLDGPDIARELVVSLNTVRTHTKNIYTKLGVHDRRAAVRRAADLDLLSRTRRGPTPASPPGA
jgi:LuxR family transcriptional regulator, maltose regulon positive regulatory protein